MLLCSKLIAGLETRINEIKYHAITVLLLDAEHFLGLIFITSAGVVQHYCQSTVILGLWNAIFNCLAHIISLLTPCYHGIVTSLLTSLKSFAFIQMYQQIVHLNN